MTTKESRPAGNGTAQVAWTAEESVPPDADNHEDPRPRCCRCGHPLTIPRSVARGYGRRCWARTVAGQADRRRDAVGASLARLARRVASLDVAGLAVVAAGVQDVVEALDAEGVAR